jgi:hypothetical protein
MFGGDLYAYTLLGIELNEKTNEARYLILDPHFQGSDNIKTIIDKQGIQWKKKEIFKEGEFYNFCMPIRPKNI